MKKYEILNDFLIFMRMATEADTRMTSWSMSANIGKDAARFFWTQHIFLFRLKQSVLQHKEGSHHNITWIEQGLHNEHKNKYVSTSFLCINPDFRHHATIANIGNLIIIITNPYSSPNPSPLSILPPPILPTNNPYHHIYQYIALRRPYNHRCKADIVFLFALCLKTRVVVPSRSIGKDSIIKSLQNTNTTLYQNNLEV